MKEKSPDITGKWLYKAINEQAKISFLETGEMQVEVIEPAVERLTGTWNLKGRALTMLIDGSLSRFVWDKFGSTIIQVNKEDLLIFSSPDVTRTLTKIS